MSEITQWALALTLSVSIIGLALFYLNSSSKKNSGELGSVTAKVGSVVLAFLISFSGFIAAAAID